MQQQFLWRWVFAVTAGEAIGFVIPAAVGAGLALSAAPGSVVYPAMIVAGAYASHGGAVPIYVEGTGHVATATVSALPQQADHDLVIEALGLFQTGKRAFTKG
ncbi:heme-binding protein [Paenarthrobacter sp. NPDC092416]|uniref:heme-binding protein n=1 Tax=Paenarthrobacter sp. NPDC092416 TaxID=3364386 RepID=UPI0038056730